MSIDDTVDELMHAVENYLRAYCQSDMEIDSAMNEWRWLRDGIRDALQTHYYAGYKEAISACSNLGWKTPDKALAASLRPIPTYAVEKTAGSVKFYVDGELLFDIDTRSQHMWTESHEQ